MGKSQDFIDSLGSKLAITRRGFVKGLAAAGTAATLYGCSKSDDNEVIFTGGGTVDQGCYRKISTLLKNLHTAGVPHRTTAAVDALPALR